jgi:ABC-type bacteriocin/lantibiotic exporter with double-glycine peptidase domain
MPSWSDYLRQGLTRTQTKDRVANPQGETSMRANLENLWPFLRRHWRMGLLCVALILFLSLLAFPQPLITRYLIDNVILAKRLDRLWWVLILLAIVKLLNMGFGTFLDYYYTRFQQIVSLDIQSDLFERLLHFPKSFFDETETGYLMARIQSDVGGVQWFFSQSVVSILTSVIRFLGGVGLLFYLQWQLALGVVVLLPLLVIALRFFSGKIRILSHAQMEQSANVSRNLQESLASTTLIKTFASEKRTVGRMISEWKAAQQLGMEQTMVGSLANLLISSMPTLANAVVLIVGACRTLWPRCHAFPLCTTSSPSRIWAPGKKWNVLKGKSSSKMPLSPMMGTRRSLSIYHSMLPPVTTLPLLAQAGLEKPP